MSLLGPKASHPKRESQVLSLPGLSRFSQLHPTLGPQHTNTLSVCHRLSLSPPKSPADTKSGHTQPSREAAMFINTVLLPQRLDSILSTSLNICLLVVPWRIANRSKSEGARRCQVKHGSPHSQIIRGSSQDGAEALGGNAAWPRLTRHVALPAHHVATPPATWFWLKRHLVTPKVLSLTAPVLPPY